MRTNARWISLALPGWAVLYYVMGYISFFIDDPVNHISFIWLPAGVAVSAFLSTIRRAWLPLFILLFIARVLLDMTFEHQMSVSLVLTVISLVNDLAIAWLVRRVSPNYDELYTIGVWLFATLFFSAISAFLGIGWLSGHYAAPFMKVVWYWWITNVVSTIFITIPLIGINWNPQKIGARKTAIAVCMLLLIAASTWFAFNLHPGGPENVPLIYMLAGVPMILTVLTSVLCGNRAGSVAFIVFSAIVIFSSWERTGPFFISGLSTGESILLAQCYLSGSALLMLFIRIQKPFRQRHDDISSPTGGARDTAYSLNMASGQLSWNPHADSELADLLKNITSAEQLLALLPDPQDKAELQARWQAMYEHRPVSAEFRFRLSQQGSQPRTIIERNTLLLPDAAGETIVGFWNEVKGGSQHVPNREEF